MTAIVAAWIDSPMSGPVNVAPTMTPAVLVDDDPRRAGRVAPVERAAGVGAAADLDDADVQAGVARAGLGVADRRDLRVGEDHARRQEAVGAQLDRLAEDVVGGDAALVLAHVRRAATRPFTSPIA